MLLCFLLICPNALIYKHTARKSLQTLQASKWQYVTMTGNFAFGADIDTYISTVFYKA